MADLRSTLDFLLYDWLAADSLAGRPRFAEHSRETFDAVLDTCERIAREKYAPFNRLVDTEEPRTETAPDGSLRVVLPRATHEARAAYAESGMLAAAQDYEFGGMQLPYLVEAAANAFFGKASISIGANLLTVGNANLLMAHGTPRQQQVFAANEFNGRWTGTMCLSEPQAGSSLSDVATRAVLEDASDPLGPRYRLRGNKMWISGGEHEMAENIVHLVLAKIPGPDGQLMPGVKGISLFIVPKKLVDAQGQLTGVRNDVTLAGLNHKLGWRGTTNTLLNFGEGKFPVDGQPGAVGYLVGQPGEGLKCMFHMMNEARIAIGMAATMLGLAGYEASLDYAKTRLQGRPVGAGGKDASQPPVRLIEHADIRRMLLAQKAAAEGAQALCLYCATLVDELATLDDPGEKRWKASLLGLLTPVVKSWPSEHCLEANKWAIQILGGYGYTRDFPLERFYRDNRLNHIHEGTFGIQGMDLIGRKIGGDGGETLDRFVATMRETMTAALAIERLQSEARRFGDCLDTLVETTQALLACKDPLLRLANATVYLDAFGHIVLGWIWLRQALAACDALTRSDPSEADRIFYDGKLLTCRYFSRYELPHSMTRLALCKSLEPVCLDAPIKMFGE